jgi:hypothetical protein
MEIAYAYLANYAEFSSDGRLTMVGGDLDAIGSPDFPSRPLNLALAIKATFLPEESGRPHLCRIEIARARNNEPDSEALAPVIMANLDLPRVGADLATGRANICGQFTGVVFPVEGDYLVRIWLDDREMRRLPLRLVHQPLAGA